MEIHVAPILLHCRIDSYPGILKRKQTMTEAARKRKRNWKEILCEQIVLSHAISLYLSEYVDRNTISYSNMNRHPQSYGHLADTSNTPENRLDPKPYYCLQSIPSHTNAASNRLLLVSWSLHKEFHSDSMPCHILQSLHCIAHSERSNGLPVSNNRQGCYHRQYSQDMMRSDDDALIWLRLWSHHVERQIENTNRYIGSYEEDMNCNHVVWNSQEHSRVHAKV